MKNKNFNEKKSFTKRWFFVAVGFGSIFAITTTLIAIYKNINTNNKLISPNKDFIQTTRNRQDIKKPPYNYEAFDTNVQNSKITDTKNQNQKDSTSTKETDKEEDTELDTTESEENQKYVKPVPGKILRKHSDDKLVYWKVLNDYRTHDGVDLEAKKNTPVKAIADGTISSIKNEDSVWGVCITIDHKDGLQSIYKGLSEQIQVKQNQKVKAGDVIGTIGTSNKVEGNLNDHLHVAMKKGEEYVNPLDYIDIK